VSDDVYDPPADRVGAAQTRSGKIMRRLLLDLASGREPGDTTSLVDPAALDEARQALAPH
jgi:acetyl-CoA synthetase